MATEETQAVPSAVEAEDESAWFWGVLLVIAATIAVAFCIVALALGTLMMIHGYERGQDKRAAQNKAQIARQQLEQRAFEQFRGR